MSVSGVLVAKLVNKCVGLSSGFRIRSTVIRLTPLDVYVALGLRIVGKKFLTLSMNLMMRTMMIVTRCLGNGTCIHARKSTNLKTKIIPKVCELGEGMDETGYRYLGIRYRMFDKDDIISQQIS
ncbi:hypothetical protein VNO77_02752 [Canavalia gladiata]|uniref:Uncharacterized protein n=1 Tax=Canavalia gladiata TaxID=3824 RepID=A0AAN9N016_CANGL